MDGYKQWVRKHRDFVHSLESLANGLTWLLPERFSNSEIGPEAVYAFLGIVSTVNQHIIDTASRKVQPFGFRESKSPWSLYISIIKDAEAVVEVAAQHFVGEERKWNYLALMEAVKAFARLAAFSDNGYKLLLQGGESVNLDETLEFSRSYNGGSPDIPNGPGYNQNLYGSIPKSLEGRAMSALSRFGENARMASDPVWLKKLQKRRKNHAHIPEKLTFANIWWEKGLLGQLYLSGEVLCIFRPLIYVILVRGYGIRSWKPWLISLAIDLTGMSFLSRATSHICRSDDKYYQLSVAEKDELKRRKMILAFYIMRDPFFSTYTRQRLEKTDKYLSKIPFIGNLTGKLLELIVGAQTRYTYTSGS